VLAVAICATIRYYWGAPPAHADSLDQTSSQSDGATRVSMRPAESSERLAPSPNRPARPAVVGNSSGTSIPAVVATVNTQRITRDELARECLRRYGNEVLETMVNKLLITQECQRQGITVTREEVDTEIQRMAKRFNIPVDQWLKLAKQEGNTTPEQYAGYIVWPTLALRKLAGVRMTVSREELAQEFETQYGAAVKVRLIAVGNFEKAKKLQAQAAANPKDFGSLAKRYSEDAPSASVKGLIQPIRKHGSYKAIEDAVFNMADGDVSPVIHAGSQYVILMREGLIEARPVKFEQVAPQLEEILRDRKMRGIAQDVFHQLQAKAKVENVWNDAARRAQMPGVAAIINEAQITIRELAEECIARHGHETLEGVISRKIIEQACKRQNIAVTETEIDQEIARAALAGVKTGDDGSPDVAAWLDLVTKKEGIPLDVYRNDMVWPSVALKKLAGGKVQVTEDDLRKGFEANYGPRVRCLAIVLNNQRRAQQVFEMARKNNTPENFGDLAAQYSIEPGSQALRGEVPPIQQHGGDPELEKEAFSLRPGELSGIIQVGDKFILLRCEGYTKPIPVKFAEVRGEIHRDLHEKKLRIEMAQCFDKLQEAAVVDNYLAGTSHAPKLSGGASPSANVPTLRQVPGG
jgi:parvulin-like peptidyl-prolyl isomerase